MSLATAEQAPIQEAREALRPASPGLMLRIANGNFEETATNLPTSPTQIFQRSYDALYANHQDVRVKDQKEWYERIKQDFKDKHPKATGELPPEELRHRHFMQWAATEAKVVIAMLTYQRDNGNYLTETALRKLGITIDENTQPNNLPDQFYSDSTHSPGEFYNTFCKGNTNQHLVNTLSAQEMRTLEIFLTTVLGSRQAFDALLATRQTQDALDANIQLPTATPPVTTNEKPIVDFFKKGMGLSDRYPAPKPATAPKPSDTPRPAEPLAEPENSGEAKKTPELKLIAGSKSEQSEYHENNEDSFFIDEENLRAGIFDGAGGHYGGDIASQTAEKTVREALAAEPSAKSAQEAQQQLIDAMQKANNQVKAFPYPAGKKHPITTGVVYQVVQENGSNKLVYVAVGDSRLWIKRADGTVECLTKDDNLAKANHETGALSDAEYIDIQSRIDRAQTPEEVATLGRLYWDRSGVHHMLGDDVLHAGSGIVTISSGDVIFLTTDGVHDNLTNQEITKIAQQINNPQELAESLVGKAKEVSQSGSVRAKPDDITAIATELEATAPALQSETANATENIAYTQQLLQEGKNKPAPAMVILAQQIEKSREHFENEEHITDSAALTQALVDNYFSAGTYQRLAEQDMFGPKGFELSENKEELKRLQPQLEKRKQDFINQKRADGYRFDFNMPPWTHYFSPPFSPEYQAANPTTFRVYVNPRPQDMPDFLESLADYAATNNIPLYFKTADPESLQRSDKVVVYLNDQNADPLVHFMQAYAQQHPETFQNRVTPPSSQVTIAPGVGLAPQPESNAHGQEVTGGAKNKERVDNALLTYGLDNLNRLFRHYGSAENLLHSTTYRDVLAPVSVDQRKSQPPLLRNPQTQAIFQQSLFAVAFNHRNNLSVTKDPSVDERQLRFPLLEVKNELVNRLQTHGQNALAQQVNALSLEEFTRQYGNYSNFSSHQLMRIGFAYGVYRFLQAGIPLEKLFLGQYEQQAKDAA